ncbi:hypothetical protein SASPL_116348 [Salvia splendens]|uniref:DELLA protein n=1 Tax=Salvia splendens TaxID=180675 RepID=A0A8X8XYK3_SALSN|nr:GRAS family protein RAM1-like [Salvia splendens]KAG6419836.1 hypothetical protein SASPL_116348 [Salvia splendens]
MLGMQEYEEEDFLCLRLSISSDSDCERKRNETPTLSDSISSDGSFEEESKILSLFQMRDQMLNLHRKRAGEDHPEESDVDGNGLRLVHLLLVAATSVDENNTSAALESLRGIYRSASLSGDSVQRVAAYFADGLVARLLPETRDAVARGPARDEAFLSYAELYKVSPLYQLAHFTANEAILEAFEKQDRANPNPNPRVLHVIDFEVSYGFQWPSLMQSLSERATPARRILLKITGYGSCPEQLQETQARLTSFAQCFQNLVFEFTGIVRGSNLAKPKIKKGEIVVANLSFHLSTLKNYSKVSETLNYLKSVRPAIVVLVEQEGSRKTHNFLSRFTESLHYFAAIFDSLDDCLPLESAERLRIEKNHLGTEIKHVMNNDRDDDNNNNDSLRFQSLETWKKRMETNGFRGVRHSTSAVMQAKLLLKMTSHCSGTHLEGENGGFRVFERDDGRALSLGWQEKLLITASSWCCV